MSLFKKHLPAIMGVTLIASILITGLFAIHGLYAASDRLERHIELALYGEKPV
tara:strand:- start:2546 stop:2704 length:159 start_codon:yes stop_codon:yes gene_type:complete